MVSVGLVPFATLRECFAKIRTEQKAYRQARQ